MDLLTVRIEVLGVKALMKLEDVRVVEEEKVQGMKMLGVDR